MSKGKIMITGATGYIGSAILVAALRSGYTANVVVRSEAKREQVATAPALLAAAPGNDVNAVCQFFTVPDLAAKGALDAATRGCDYVIHAASPIPFVECAPEEQRATILEPAVACTLSALESAKAAGGTVKRVVCTSSIGAFVEPAMLGSEWAPPAAGQNVYVNEASLQPDREPPFVDMATAYCASKTAALRRSLEWMEREGAQNVGFDLVALGPAYVCGRHPLAASTKDLWATSNWRFLRLFAAGKPEPGAVAPPPEAACGTHIDDVVDLHLMALDREKIKTKAEGEPGAGTEFFTTGVDMRWEDVNELTAKLFPKEVEAGILPNGGYAGTYKELKFYSDKVEKAFGIKLKGLEEMVGSLVPQYLELLEKEK
ncbi:putative 3-beta hydroxysteroid dehydrogenase protein [Lasiodiplodia theobromae]|uniref:Vestitone reductase n=1 Tax=Lasiodiplodia theobromae TaxID=45133 RepID=A0A5N5DI98_9PEZI|nr:uncharacterized protein LTHEOB_2648 [Lasiodiplodia theobromae]KAB2577608.1 Vestitone reductase [Lasiodiplodia theobromae]KAF4535656.1 hypothetical protein LTHEOB_2648 [Lasiodiplodia theobromae]KAF9638941.1 putative 3-beta hydroxysteroid dehydrogenase protein [Lasiodiplodia theobromae]